MGAVRTTNPYNLKRGRADSPAPGQLMHDLDFSSRDFRDKGRSPRRVDIVGDGTFVADGGPPLRPTYIQSIGVGADSYIIAEGLPSDGSCFATAPTDAYTIIAELSDIERSGIIRVFVGGAGDALALDGFSLAVLNNNKLVVFNSPDGTATELLITSALVPEGASFSFAYVKTATTMHAYLNGRLVGKKTAGVSSTLAGTKIGFGVATASTRWCDARISRLRMWRGAFHDLPADPRILSNIGVAV